MKRLFTVSIITVIVICAISICYFLCKEGENIFNEPSKSPSENLAVADSLYNAGNYQAALTNYHLIVETYSKSELTDTADIHSLLTAALMEAQIYSEVYNNYGNTLKALNNGEKIADKYGLSKEGLNFLFGTLYFTIASQNDATEYYDKGAPYFIRNVKNETVSNLDLRDYSVTNLILFSNYGNIRDRYSGDLKEYFTDRRNDSSKNYAFNLSLDSLMQFVNEKDYSEASRIAMRLRADTTLPMQRVIPGIYFISGKIMEESGSLEEAGKFFEISESLIDPENGADMLLNVYEGIETVNKKMHNDTKADEYAEKSREIRKELTSFAQISSLKNAEVEEEISNIKDNLDNQTKMSNNLKKGLILTGIILLISVLFIFLLLYFSRRLKENNKALYQRYQDLLKLRDTANVKKQLPDSGENQELNEGVKVFKTTENKWVEYSEEIKKIDNILNNSEEIFSSEFSAVTLSAMTDINPHTLSSIISGYYNSTFRKLINTYRIRAVCERLENSSVYDNLTIDAIAEDVGIKSRTTFTSAFKEETGMTPGKYLQFARQRK